MAALRPNSNFQSGTLASSKSNFPKPESESLSSGTIAAIASPFGESAIALIRLSGPAALEIADRVCKYNSPRKHASKLKPRYAYRAQFGQLKQSGCTPTWQPLDEGLVTIFRSPASYTGEDLVEISCHGGRLVTRRILEALLAAGAQSAEPGEFTQRAFLNGKLDLTQAEAVMDLIRAQTDLALRSATEQLEGRLGSRIHLLREELLNLVAHIEAYIDFPEEEGIDPDTGQKLLLRIDNIDKAIDELLATADQGRIIREGVQMVICGEPNVGKSSLLNALIGYERAIVSAIPGTTRDTVEEFIQLRGIPFHLVDTAGLRSTSDEIEREGIARTHRSIARADLVLQIFDSTQPAPSSLDEQWKVSAYGGAESKSRILVLNKSDLPPHPSWSTALKSEPQFLRCISISCQTSQGLPDLVDCIYNMVTSESVVWNNAVPAINARHQNQLAIAQQALQLGRQLLAKKEAPEFIAQELRASLEAIGEIVGVADTEEILGKIFSTFCIGK